MEHELFQSKLKPLVDTTLLSKTIRTSSSGENPHRAAALVLILERSIQERCKRTFTGVNSTPRRDPAPKPQRSSSVPDVSTLQVESPSLAPPPQQSSQLSPDDDTSILENPVSAPAKCKTSRDSQAVPEPGTRVKEVVQREEPPADTKVIPRPACRKCIKQMRDHRCKSCLGPMIIMKCVRCGSLRANAVEICTRCRGGSKQ